jgi:hypothetical protein
MAPMKEDYTRTGKVSPVQRYKVINGDEIYFTKRAFSALSSVA